MSDWRTATAPGRRLPEDDLPDIDWGEASFTQGGGDAPEPEPMPDPGEEERAMARLRARIAERDAAEGLIDPWSQAQAAPMGPQTSPPLPGSPAPLRAPRGGRTMAGSGLATGLPEMLPQAPPVTPERQSALDAVRAGVGAVTPPVDPMAPPPSPTAPEAVPQATTDPSAPTVTAGSQAAGLAQRPQAPPQGQQAPNAAPGFAMGATGLQGPQAGMSERVQAGVGGGVFDRQVGAARDEDMRRDRIRRIITGIGAMLALRSGNAGFMVPAAIAGGLVRPSDEEATLRANDERAQAVGGAQAEQRALLEQLAMRREAQQAQERQGQQTLALRAQELAGADADRDLRTGIQLRENEREEDLLRPESSVSGRERAALESTLATQPPEVQRAYAGRLAGMAATELRSIREELRSTGNARTMAGGFGRGRGLTNPDGTPIGGGTGPRPGQLANEAPRSHVLTVVNRIGNGTPEGGTYENPSEYAIRVANAEWAAMTPRQQQDARADVMGQEQAGRQVPGFIAGENVAESDTAKAREVHAAARRLTSALATMIALSDDAGLADRARAGVNLGEDAARYRTARQSVITAIRTVRGLGTPQGQELAQLEAEIESMSSLSQFMNGSVGLRAARDQFANDALITMESYGYRPEQQGANPLIMGPRGTSPGPTPTTTADAPPAPEREHTITIRFTRNGETRSRTVPISEADRWRAQGVAAGWTVVQ